MVDSYAYNMDQSFYELEHEIYRVVNARSFETAHREFMARKRELTAEQYLNRIKLINQATKERRYSKSLIKEWFSNDSSTSCSICLSEYKVNQKVSKVGQTPCYFHTKCIQRWLRENDSCPNCRQIVVTTD